MHRDPRRMVAPEPLNPTSAQQTPSKQSRPSSHSNAAPLHADAVATHVSVNPLGPWVSQQTGVGPETHGPAEKQETENGVPVSVVS